VNDNYDNVGLIRLKWCGIVNDDDSVKKESMICN